MRFRKHKNLLSSFDSENGHGLGWYIHDYLIHIQIVERAQSHREQGSLYMTKNNSLIEEEI